ncbi:MAG: hypothetical protein N2749_06430 [Clostridia bacterium]|nr:hypothetical protein [Clostridia bacterium]
MEPLIQMNKFEIIDMPGMNTLAFVVEENLEEYKRGNAYLSLQKIECDEVEESGKLKKVFNVIATEEDKQYIVLLTLTKSKAILSTGELTKNGFTAVERNIPLSYGTIYNQEGVEYKEISYTPDFKRHFSIIDTQSGEEIKPRLYVDDKTNAIKGRCKILPNRPYIVLELKLEEEKSS